MNDYRNSHLGATKAEEYEAQFSDNLPGIFWRDVERPLLDEILDDVFPAGLQSVSHLDVACGTGRILRHVSQTTASSLGVDISPDMLAVAAEMAPRATTRLADVSSVDLGERFDLITAFRFFLNAQPDLRDAVAESIDRHLAEGGVVLANVHASPASAIGVYRRARRRVGMNADETMSHDDFIEMFDAIGFEPVSERVYGVIPVIGRVHGERASSIACKIDQAAVPRLGERSPIASTYLAAFRRK